MLPETVTGLPDKGRQVQFENEGRRIELDRFSRRPAVCTRLGDKGITQRRWRSSTCHSPRRHALSISV
jgi:hypothetical protein